MRIHVHSVISRAHPRACLPSIHAISCSLHHFACTPVFEVTYFARGLGFCWVFRMYAKKNFHAPYTRSQVIHLISHVRQLLEPPTLHAGWVTEGHFACKQKLFCDTHTRGFRQNQPFRVYKPKKLHIPNRRFPKMQHFL